MPVNLEIKLKLNSFEGKKKLLKQIGAKRVGLLTQKDIYYSHPPGLLKLRIENGTSSLIYYNRDEKKINRWSEYYLLKFGKENPSEFFKRLFIIETVVDKRRELFIYDNTRIHLDMVKGLGKFLELETLIVNGKADAQKRFKFLIDSLKLDPSKQIKKSYRSLLIKKKNTR
jgi:predicted adenylyl cyclase CyaB